MTPARQYTDHKPFLKIGARVHALHMPEGSYFKQVRGEVTAINNGWVRIQADHVINCWSRDDKWERHPGHCGTSAKIDHVIEESIEP